MRDDYATGSLKVQDENRHRLYVKPMISAPAELFVALAEERSFTRAAAREHIAQPALSQQIRRLEDECGLMLVQRSTRSVTITPAGQSAAHASAPGARRARGGRRRAGGAAWRGSRPLTIGAIPTMGPVDISIPLAAFHQRHPRVELTVREALSDELAEMLRADVLDLAFLSVTGRIELQSHRAARTEPPSPAHRGAGRDVPARPPARAAPACPYGGAGRRDLRQLFAREHACGNCCSPRPATRASTPKVTLESSESQPSRALVHPRDGCRDPAPLRRGRTGPGRRCRNAERTGPRPRHHARLPRGAPAHAGCELHSSPSCSKRSRSPTAARAEDARLTDSLSSRHCSGAPHPGGKRRLENQIGESLWHLHRQHVSAVCDLDQPRTRDLLGERPPGRRRHDQIVATDDDRRRCGDPAQAPRAPGSSRTSARCSTKNASHVERPRSNDPVARRYSSRTARAVASRRRSRVRRSQDRPR